MKSASQMKSPSANNKDGFNFIRACEDFIQTCLVFIVNIVNDFIKVYIEYESTRPEGAVIFLYTKLQPYKIHHKTYNFISHCNHFY